MSPPAGLIGTPGAPSLSISSAALVTAVSSGQSLPVPPAWSLAAVVLGSLLVLAGLTAIPARIGARHSVAEVLQADAT